MSRFPSAFGGISLHIYDMEGLLKKYEETPSANIKEQALNLIQEELNVRYEMEDPEDVYYFSTEPDFIFDPQTMSEIAQYAEGVGEFTFPDSSEYEPENTTRRIYLHEGRVYEDIPEVLWHPPAGMDLSLLGHEEERDDPLDTRLEMLSEKYKDGVYNVEFTITEGGRKELRGSTGALNDCIALAHDRARATPDIPVIIKDKDNNLFNAGCPLHREKKQLSSKGR